MTPVYLQERIHRTLAGLTYQFTLSNPDLRETRRLIEVLMDRYLQLEAAHTDGPLIDLLIGNMRSTFPDETLGELEQRAISALQRPHVRETAMRIANQPARWRERRQEQRARK